MMMVCNIYRCQHGTATFCSFSVASFAIPATSGITEGGSTLLCVQMVAISTAVTLGIDVVVNLSTENGSGLCVCY